MPGSTDAFAETPPSRRRFLAWPILLGSAAFVFAFPLLAHSLGSLLVHLDEPKIHGDVVVVGGDDASALATHWLQEHPDSRLLVFKRPDPRVVQIGAADSDDDRILREVSKASDIDPDRIIVLPGQSMRDVHYGRLICRWLAEYPERGLTILCDEFQSRSWRLRLDHHLAPDAAARVYIEPLKDRRYSAQEWWKSRLGMRAFFSAMIGLTRSKFSIQSSEPPKYLSPEEYEAAFVASLQKEARPIPAEQR